MMNGDARCAWWPEGIESYVMERQLSKVLERWSKRLRAAIFPAMFSHETQVRVRYGETDQMGYVYYGDYAEYFEVGRVEALRSLGFAYKRLEEEGVMLPVRELHVTYHQPARYDDLLTLRTIILQQPSVRIVFNYEVRNEAGVLLCEASTMLVFVDRATMRPCRAPEAFLEAMARHFSDH